MKSEEHKLFKVNQAAVIKNVNGQVLILKRSGKWMLPGGRLEGDTSSSKGLAREIKEETGITNCKVEQIVDARLSKGKNTYMVTFLCSTDKKIVKLSDEHIDYAWVSKGELNNYKFEYDEIKKIINLYYGK